MAYLLTGGTGKTSTRLASILSSHGLPYLTASRRADPSTDASAVKFDWLDKGTWSNPFDQAKEKIKGVYIVQPQVGNAAPIMQEFIEFAVDKHGVRRFVQLAGSGVEKGEPGPGKTWEFLEEQGGKGRLEWAVLRCTWFMENFAEWQHPKSIKDENKIYTACGDGKIAFVSTFDIANVAYHGLTDEKALNSEYRILGPELITHDDVAKKFSTSLGRPIENVHLTEEEAVQRYLSHGGDERFARRMAGIEMKTSTGFEDLRSNAVEEITGQKPMTIEKWIEERKGSGVWG